MSFFPMITVAAVDSITGEKGKADFVCSGKNDELVINKAIMLAAKENKIVYLLDGNYHIDDFYDFKDGGPKAAICTPTLQRDVSVVGQNFCYTKHTPGVQLNVSEQALAKVGEGEYSVFRTQWAERGIYSGTLLKLENITLVLAHNQTAIRAIDLRRCDRLEMKNVRVNAYGNSTNKIGPDRVATEGCIGITMTDGSNNFIVRYDNVAANGFYEGIQVGGEHVVMINCAASACYYGYTFGNYEMHCGFNHPITMINCCDERNVNLPLFNQCGDSDGTKDGRIIGGQEVTMISFNVERLAEHTPGQKLGDAMRELHPGAFCGRIEYTLQPAWNHTNETDFKLFENGSGIGFRAINMTHKTVCTTAERLSYYPSLGQQIFDTDLNKLVICIDADTKKWVDANGCDADS